MAEAVPSEVPYAVVLQYHRQRRRCHPIFLFQRTVFISTAALLLLLSSAFILFPDDPKLQISRIRLNTIKINRSPSLTVDISFFLMVRIWNPNFAAVDYDSLTASIKYRNRELGFVKSDGGVLAAREVSYIDATVDLNGLQIVHDAFYLIQDLARGVVTFDTVSSIKGNLVLAFLRIPIKGTIACSVLVNVDDQTVSHQSCYPEVRQTFPSGVKST